MEIAGIPGGSSGVGESRAVVRQERVQAVERVDRDTRFPALPGVAPRVDRAEFSAEALGELARELPCAPHG
jgi:hypothetical protein